jgi:hypothetical protein
MTVFFKLSGVALGEQAVMLLDAVKGDGADRFEVDIRRFATIPGSPFAYWAPEAVSHLFLSMPRAENEERRFTKGLCTTNDPRFLRAWWEVSPTKLDTFWVNFVNGGTTASYYAETEVVLNWNDNGKELKAYLDQKIGASGQWSRWINSVEHYGKPGMSWPLRTAKYSPRALPAGHIFSVRSYVGFAERQNIGALIAFTSSTAFDFIFKTCLGRSGHPEFVVGVIQRLPLPSIDGEVREQLEEAFMSAWRLAREPFTVRETARVFVLPLCLRPLQDRALDLAVIASEIDKLSMSLYGFTDTEQKQIYEWIEAKSETYPDGSSEEELDSDEENVDEDVVDQSGTDFESLVSWCIGVQFGRFDLRLATGERHANLPPDPFACLPPASPAMGVRQDTVPSCILVDDQRSPDDVAHAISVIMGEACGHGNSPVVEISDLRKWIADKFFAYHLKMYSRSRRRAPIYWRLTGPSASYSIWLYLHSLSKDTFFRVQDIAEVKLRMEADQLAILRSEIPTSLKSSGKHIEAQEKLVADVSSLLDEVKRVAPLWNPNLDDGVLINAAPLWRLFPHHKPWQKECKSTWEELCQGKLDWAHLAMHLWPERVVPECAADRSLAIAHGLEDVFWFEDKDGKWKPLDEPARPVAEIIAERTSPAVKAALKNLIEAPDTTAPVKRSRKAKTS